MLMLRLLSRSLAISTLLIKYAKNEPEGVQLKSILTKNDFLCCVHVVVETLNLDISRGCLTYHTSKKCAQVRVTRGARLFFPIQPIRS